MNAYKKEAALTIGFFVAYLLMAHTAPWVIVLGMDNSIRVLGYPLHYFMAIVLGWFGVLAVAIVWNYCADKLEDEIAAEDEECQTSSDRHASRVSGDSRAVSGQRPTGGRDE